MKISKSDLQQRVVNVVAAALDRNPADIHLYSSLIDDLGAESIDFLDIRFRVETEFGIKVADEELWEGELHLASSGLMTDRGVSGEGRRLLQQRMPDFRWDRFSGDISRADLPRLITPGTIIGYLERRLQRDGAIA